MPSEPVVDRVLRWAVRLFIRLRCRLFGHRWNLHSIRWLAGCDVEGYRWREIESSHCTRCPAIGPEFSYHRAEAYPYAE